MRRLLPVLLFGLLVLATSACDEGGDGPVRSESAPALSDGARESGPSSLPETDRKEIVTGTIMLTAADPVAAGRQVVTIVEAAGGRVDSVTEAPERSSTLTVRVPPARLDAVLAEVGDLGKVTSLTTSRDDVTMQYTDLEARIAALRTSVDRLRALIESATNTADLIAAEAALTERQADLDSLEARRRQLAEQVDLSTLTVDIGTEARPSDQDSFWDGLVAGWNGLRAALAAAVVAAGVAVPWVGFLVVSAFVVYAVVRLLARIGRSARPDRERTPAPGVPGPGVPTADTAATAAAAEDPARGDPGAAPPDTPGATRGERRDTDM